jgi:uncharacterized protein YoxC
VTAGDLAAVFVAIASVIAVVLLTIALLSMLRTLNALRIAVEDLRRETLPVVTELQQTVSRANAELERVDGLLVSAESVTATVDSFSNLAYLAFSNPLVKILAFGAGTSRAARALRRDR